MLHGTLSRYFHLGLRGLGFVVVVAFASSLFNSPVVAAADYPADWCEFLYNADQTKITASCTDNKDNGTFDGAIFNKVGSTSKYTFSDSYPLRNGTEETCTATITISGRTATMSGKYFKKDTIAGRPSYSCSDVGPEMNVPSTSSAHNSTWNDTFDETVSEALIKACIDKGAMSAADCRSVVPAAVAACRAEVDAGTTAPGAITGGTQGWRERATTCIKTRLAGFGLTLSNSVIANAVKAGDLAADEAQTAEEAANNIPANGGDPVCDAGGFGWVICPLINMIGEVSDAVAGFLDDYLRVEPLLFDTSSDLYKGWANMVGIANIVLILAVLAIVFSQATSVGISNYGVKKMLPKVVAAAIMINISYFICALLVDISNILGSGVTELINGSLGGGPATSSADGQGIVGGIKQVTGLIAAGAIASAGLVVVAFFFLIPALLAILTLFIVVAARSAIITLLIITAPLAFAAWVLPNTEKYYKKWWDLFIQMLVIYPAVMAMFAAAGVAAAIVAGTS